MDASGQARRRRRGRHVCPCRDRDRHIRGCGRIPSASGRALHRGDLREHHRRREPARVRSAGARDVCLRAGAGRHCGLAAKGLQSRWIRLRRALASAVARLRRERGPARLSRCPKRRSNSWPSCPYRTRERTGFMVAVAGRAPPLGCARAQSVHPPLKTEAHAKHPCHYQYMDPICELAEPGRQRLAAHGGDARRA